MNDVKEEILGPLLNEIMTLRVLPLYTVGSEFLMKSKMNEKQIMILREIEHAEGQGLISTIADDLFLDRPQVSRVVDKLEDMELVNRKRTSRKQDKKADRRRVKLEVTSKGLTFLSQFYEERHQFYTKIIDSYGLREAREFSQFLEKFNELISEKIESIIDQK